MADRLERLINLANKNGDKLVVYDKYQPEDSYVVISLRDYEKMLSANTSVRGLTEDELIDKINQDIATWKSERLEVSESAHFSGNISDQHEAPSPAWQPPTQSDRPPKRNAWTIPENRKRGAQEVVGDEPAGQGEPFIN